jgi:UDP-N-acetylglucosamine 2-epimerase (non-hydrolysing)
VRVHLIAAARPNFMKVAPVWHELVRHDWADPVLVHTGQHYDPEMSDAFLRDLGLPEPHHHLGAGSGSHAQQTAAVMVAYEQALLADRPDVVVVVGDVNSTMACALTATKLHLPVAHLEAGLRSFDRTMPEEVNRVVTDAIADLLWTPSADADENLRREGVPAERVERVGNVMIDSFELQRERIEAAATHERFGLAPGGYGVVTLHRPANVDDPAVLEVLVEGLRSLVAELPLVFPVHPRTRARLEATGLGHRLDGVTGLHLSPPLGYVDFLGLVVGAAVAVTDSGGLQEETTYLGIPCVTLRPSTERPVTVTEGTNRLATPAELVTATRRALAEASSWNGPPELWDGRTATRVAASLRRHVGG